MSNKETLGEAFILTCMAMVLNISSFPLDWQHVVSTFTASLLIAKLQQWAEGKKERKQ
ncbi:hypothetical protein OXT66_05770 [Lentilactobacillus senioris]|uniref:hypothetical protein n=1 Tax=Lentilactobacillus senioris TaxID=931534 RepID=UPI00227F0B80|nr:hypothetical protein [Lentilactobacillus senioris]MCY9807057.1 hypothetical protein [Lentilactobacillus senioris]